jgi:hypothetical protein
MSPVLRSHCTILRSAQPASSTFCLSGCGCSFTQCGTLPGVTALMTLPVSVSHSLMSLSYEHVTKRVPSLLKQMSFTACVCPMYVRMHLPLPCTSQIFTFESMPADSSRWPVPGKKRMADTPLVWPLLRLRTPGKQVRWQRVSKTHACS